MDTLEFFSIVAPSAGVKYIAEARPRQDNPRALMWYHYGVPNAARMSQVAHKLDGEGRTVYFACAGFDEPRPKLDAEGNPEINEFGKQRMQKRTAELALVAKSLWLDIDCGAEKAAKGAGYETKAHAYARLQEVISGYDLPNPLVIDSGGGLHVYWLFDRDVLASEWLPVAKKFRALMRYAALRVDPSRDNDIASVLRPVGTHNRKPGRPVAVVRLYSDAEYDVTPFSLFKWKVASLVDALRLDVPTGPTSNSEFSDGIGEPSPSSAVAIANQCAQLAYIRDMKGDVPEPYWRAMIGIVKHCVEGEALAQEWSSGHPSYDPDATREKFERYTAGPPTCQHFATHSDRCTGCPSLGKIKSPIVLGRGVVQTPAPIIQVLNENKELVAFEPPPLREGYEWRNNMLGVWARSDEEGEPPRFRPFSRVHFFGVERVISESGVEINFCAVEPNKAPRYFLLPLSVLESNRLMEHLGEEGFVRTNNNDAMQHLRNYLRDEAHALHVEGKEVRAYETFGWQKNMTEFVLGDRCYDSQGNPRNVLTKSNVGPLREAFKAPAADATPWVESINTIYNRPDSLPMQYAICAGFGSLLIELGHPEYKGVPVALVSESTGKGKSTVCKAVLWAFGDAEALTVNGQQGSTAIARTELLGGLKNLPVLFDELTNMAPQSASEMLYETSNGKGRLRAATRDGETRLRDGRTWALHAFVTANRPITLSLASAKAESSAEAVRIFEINVDEYSLPVLDTKLVQGAPVQWREAQGAAGDLFIRHMMANRDAIREKLAAVNGMLLENARFPKDPAYRFFRHHIATTLTAGTILRELGLVQFPLQPLFDWAITHAGKLADTVTEFNTSSPLDALSSMLAALASQIIVTFGYRDGRAGQPEAPQIPVRGEPVGRWVRGDGKTAAEITNKLFIAKNAVRKWCSENRVNYNQMKAAAKLEGILVDPQAGDRFVIGRGTSFATGQARCYCFDMAKLDVDVSHLQAREPLQVVVDNTAPQGEAPTQEESSGQSHARS